jgi:cytidylate kinase
MSQEDKVRKLHKDLLLRIKPRIQPSEWQTFLRALKYYGIDITNLNTAKDLSTDEQWDDVIKSWLIPTAQKMMKKHTKIKLRQWKIKGEYK